MKKRIAELRLRTRVLLILVLVGLAALAALVVASPGTGVQASDLTPLSLNGVERILILAPHCDDETLSSAGLILAAQRRGIEVRVVIATNGDGYLFATMEDFRKLYPQPQDFIHMGKLRQQESLAALNLLGVDSENVYFLSYPDRGSPSLWNDNWSAQTPYRSPYSQDTKSPYPLTYNPGANYSGEDYLADVTTIIDDYRPDLIVYPHPEDVHPDHWGLNNFTRLAVTEVEHADSTYAPIQLTYLVHRPDFPTIRGLKPDAGLVPPPLLYEIYPEWLRWDLTPADVVRKGQAVKLYKSQLPLLRGLMESFVRTNELIAPVTSADMSIAVVSDPLIPSTWQDAGGETVAPIILDPVGDGTIHESIPATDLTAVYAAQTPTGDLWICAELHENAVEDISYSLRFKALTETGIRSYIAHTNPKSGQATATRSGIYVCAQSNLTDLGDPWAIFLGAEVESPDANVPFDKTAWQMINIKP